MSKKDENNWALLVLISIIILAVIFIFKVLFWVSLVAIVVGIVWLIFQFASGDWQFDFNWIPVILVVGGIILAVVSYGIGYKFEQTELGKPIVDSARTIVDADKQISEAEEMPQKS